MFFILRHAFEVAVRDGAVEVVDCSGRAHLFGDGTPPAVRIRIHDAATERALAFDPELALGEAYAGGSLTVERGSIYDLLVVLMRRNRHSPMPRAFRILERLRYLLRRLDQYNPVSRSSANVRHHYDIDRAIYSLFLDPAWQYSCAYFPTPETSLADAQQAKLRHIAAKLHLREGQRVLDIGSGWGGLATYLAEAAGSDVLGVTLSPSQIAEARSRATARGLDRMVRFSQKDYRELDDTFDRIVSVGMFEHVGLNHYPAFFGKVRDLLADDGVALVHTIGRSDGPGYTNPFIARHIFPGGYFPALSEVLPVIEKSGLIVADVEVLRLHYAETLKAWREAFLSRRAEAARLKGEAFCRLWEFYLAGSEAAFRHQGLVVFQIQLVKRIDALPLTRDYMADNEAALAPHSGDSKPLLLAGE